MGLKKFKAKKEIKKLRRRSNKLKKVGVIGALIGTIFIISSYALYSYTGSSLAFNSTINKRVKTTVNVTNGRGGETKEGDYKVSQTFTITPNDGYVYESVSCTNSAQASYNANTKTLTISNQTKDTVCTVTLNEFLNHRIIASNTIKSQTPNFAIGEPPTSGSNTGSGLYKTNDDDGITYYFRGAVSNNYVSFAGVTWRVVRINGDETIRLILNQKIGRFRFNSGYSDLKYVGFTYSNDTPCTKTNPCQVTFNNVATSANYAFINTHKSTNSDIKMELEKWYYNNLKQYDNKIAYGTFCNDTSMGNGDANYKAYLRVLNNKPSLKCDDTANTYGGVYKLKIGILTAEDLIMGGIPVNYVYEAKSTNFLYSITDTNNWWTLTPRFDSSAEIIITNFNNYVALDIGAEDADNYNDVIPVINLNKDILYLSGDGSKTSPFVIN